MTLAPLHYLSLTGQSAWQDLLRLLKEEAVLDIRGKPTLRLQGGRGYWYDRYRVGDRIIERYLGDDTEDLRHRLDRQEALRTLAKGRQVETARLVRLLRSEGYLTPDLPTGQILTAMARAGVFRLGGMIVGTHAFRHYKGVLGVRVGADQAARTNDIDIASFEPLSVAVQDQVDPAMADVFSGLEFEPLPSVDERKVWRWRQTRQQTLVEFLTPSLDDEQGLRDLPALGVSAQSLHFLNYLIAEPLTVPLLYRSGALIQVPRPERFAIHKLIVSERRRGFDALQKAQKDRSQAAFLIRVLSEEDPHALAAAHGDALAKGPAWRDAITAALMRLPETAKQLQLQS